jgi:hypothetical protein
LGLDAIVAMHPQGTFFSKYADGHGSYDKHALALSWTTDKGQWVGARYPGLKQLNPQSFWHSTKIGESYREHGSGLTPKRYMYRGQTAPFRLRTSFHRSGRAHLHKFLAEDIPGLYRHLSAPTKHFFNLNIPDENGASFNLVQHHGFPPHFSTGPTLRMSRRSSHIAAFLRSTLQRQSQRTRFAYSFSTKHQLNVLIRPGLHVSIREFVAVENERMIPQQAASMITNTDDISNHT